MPRKVRWAKEPVDVPTRPVSKSPEDLAELGEVDFDSAGGPNVERRESMTESEITGFRRTAAGATHGDRYNDAGQPVFEYQPREENSTHRERTNDTHDANRSNKEDLRNYGIDSEPLGRREHDDVEEGDRDPDEFRNWWARIRAKHPEPLAEFLAVCFFSALFKLPELIRPADRNSCIYGIGGNPVCKPLCYPRCKIWHL